MKDVMLNDKIRILFVIDTLMCGGAQKMLTYIANTLSKDYEVYILSYADNTPNFLLDKTVCYIGGEGYKFKGFIKHFERISIIRNTIFKTKPNIIIAFAQIPTILSIIGKIGSRVPVVFCERGDPNQYRAISMRLKLWLVNLSDYCVFQTKGAQQFYSKRLQRNSVIIPNPVTSKPIDRIPWNKRRNEIAFVGRMDVWQKRQDLMVEAFEIVHRVLPSVSLHFYGDGDDMELIRKKVNDLGLSSSVVLEGKVDDVQNHIKHSKIFVLASDFEGIPNALIEAMSIGLPCIATDCSPGGARTLINDGENGIIVPCGDKNILADRIVFLFEHAEIAEKLGEAAQGIVNDLSPEKIIYMWESMICHISKLSE